MIPRSASLARCAALLAALAIASPPPARAETSGPKDFWSTVFGQPASPSDVESEQKAKKEEQARQDAILLEQLKPHDLIVSPTALGLLAQAVEQYQQIVNAGGWPLIPKGRTLRAGDMDESVGLLWRRLQMSGDLPPGEPSSWAYSEAVAEGVARFQRRHGIPPNGVLDRRTLAALNVPAMERLAQLRVNLLRLQELLANPLPERYVMVNVPAMELQAVQSGRIELDSRVIVGRPERPTPTVAAKIVGLNFFPFWRVPESVAFKDLIPKLAKDPDYLQREHIRVLTDWSGEEIDPRSVDWSNPQYLNIRFRQDPGEFNALGLVRIDMPNPDNVYMHDTPMKPLFGRSSRAYSAGCVRVQNVFNLVAWLASANGDWDRARVDSVLQSGFATDVKLNAPVDVYFVYLTTWVDSVNGLSFRQDIYGRDGLSSDGRDDREEREAIPQQALAP